MLSPRNTPPLHPEAPCQVNKFSFTLHIMHTLPFPICDTPATHSSCARILYPPDNPLTSNSTDLLSTPPTPSYLVLQAPCIVNLRPFSVICPQRLPSSRPPATSPSEVSSLPPASEHRCSHILSLEVSQRGPNGQHQMPRLPVLQGWPFSPGSEIPPPLAVPRLTGVPHGTHSSLLHPLKAPQSTTRTHSPSDPPWLRHRNSILPTHPDNKLRIPRYPIQQQTPGSSILKTLPALKTRLPSLPSSKS